ncbi:MAG: inositol monophosphatase family protein [Thermoguttaceae bacterium]
MKDFITTAEKAVREGGAVLEKMLGRAKVREKGPADLVTEADFASQEVVRNIVLGAFPDHGFLGEETHPDGEGQTDGSGEYRWILDPLDGTTNYVHGVPHFCVALALERRGQVVAGAVYSPMEEECYLAEVGKGAYLNGVAIFTSKVVDMSQSLAAVGLPSVVGPESPDLRLFNEALRACQGVRRTGSAALNLCYIAAGRFDVAWNYSTKIWDVAAGALIIQEAGGAIGSPYGGQFELGTGQLFSAANDTLLSQLNTLARTAGLVDPSSAFGSQD